MVPVACACVPTKVLDRQLLPSGRNFGRVGVMRARPRQRVERFLWPLPPAGWRQGEREAGGWKVEDWTDGKQAVGRWKMGRKGSRRLEGGRWDGRGAGGRKVEDETEKEQPFGRWKMGRKGSSRLEGGRWDEGKNGQRGRGRERKIALGGRNMEAVPAGDPMQTSNVAYLVHYGSAAYG
eukprot:366024-Chlamydomonas_euryale.AAC.5